MGLLTYKVIPVRSDQTAYFLYDDTENKDSVFTLWTDRYGQIACICTNHVILCNIMLTDITRFKSKDATEW